MGAAKLAESQFAPPAPKRSAKDSTPNKVAMPRIRCVRCGYIFCTHCQQPKLVSCTTCYWRYGASGDSPCLAAEPGCTGVRLLWQDTHQGCLPHVQPALVRHLQHEPNATGMLGLPVQGGTSEDTFGRPRGTSPCWVQLSSVGHPGPLAGGAGS